MTRLLTLALLVLIAVTGCTSQGAIDPNLAARLDADRTCLTSLTQQGITLSKDKVTAQAVLDTVNANVKNPDVQAACAALIGAIMQDVQAGKIQLKAAKQPAAPAAATPK